MKKLNKMFAVLIVFTTVFVLKSNAQNQWTTPVYLTNEQTYSNNGKYYQQQVSSQQIQIVYINGVAYQVVQISNSQQCTCGNQQGYNQNYSPYEQAYQYPQQQQPYYSQPNQSYYNQVSYQQDPNSYNDYQNSSYQNQSYYSNQLSRQPQNVAYNNSNQNYPYQQMPQNGYSRFNNTAQRVVNIVNVVGQILQIINGMQ